MPDLFTGFFQPVSQDVWRDAIEDGLPVGQSLDSLTWKPERNLAVNPALNVLPKGHDCEPRFGPKSELIVCDNLRDIPDRSIDECITCARAEGASGIDIDAQQFLLLMTGTGPVRGLVSFVNCCNRSLWDSVMAECRKNAITKADGLINILYDPFSELLINLDRGTHLELPDQIRVGLDLASDSVGSRWSVDVSCEVLQKAGIVTRTAYTLAAVSSMFQEIARQNTEFSRAESLVRIVWPIGNQFVLEVAALRSLRLLIPQILGSIFDVPVDGSSVLIHATNRRGDFLAVDPKTGVHGRLIPSSFQGAVAMISGCDSLSLTLSPGEGQTVSSEEARRWLRNIPFILKHEGMLNTTADPLAGSYVVEELTDQISVRSWKIFLDIEAAGGLETESGRNIILGECESDTATANEEKNVSDRTR